MKYLIALLLALCCASAQAQMPPPGPVVTNPTGKEYLGIVNSAPGTSIQLNTIATFVGGGGGGGSLVIGTTPISGGSNGAFLNDNGGTLGQVGTTGGGSVVLSTSPVLTTPDLGTPSAITLTNGTGLPVTAITGLGSGVVTSLATNTDTNGGIALYGTAGTIVNGTSCVIGSTCSVTITSFPISGLTGAGSGVLSAMANGVNAANGLLTYGIIGTSGASVPLLNQGNTWSGGTQTINSVSILGGSITGLSAPVNPTDAATKMYVDNSAVGLTTHTPVVLATTAALAANTYNNGSSGVGATITANSSGNLVIDGTTNPPTTTGGVPTRVLIKNEGTPANNGIYTVTTTGPGVWVLTRATDADTPGTLDPTKIGFGTYVLVTGGSTNLNSSWTVNSTVTTIGSSSINWAQFTAGFNGVASIGGQAGVIGIDSTLHFSGSNLGVAGVVNGTTQISSGTSGDILANNAGVLGQVGTTGSGSVVLATSAALTTPNLGTPSAVTLTNATGLPVSTGISGLGTGVATALGNAVNTSGGFATYGAPGSNTDVITNSSGIFAGSSNFTWTQTGGLVQLNSGSFSPTISSNGTVIVGTGAAGGGQLAGQGTSCDSALDNRSAANVLCVAANSGNVGIGTTSPAFDGDSSTFFAVNNSTTNASAEIGVGGNATSPGSNVGEINFYNSSLGTTDKRIAAIAGVTIGATNSGLLQFYTWNAGSAQDVFQIDQTGSSAFRDMQNYADLRLFASLSCNAASPTSTNVALAAITAYTAGYRSFYIPPGCFIYTGDSIWVAAFGAANLIPSGTFWIGGDQDTSGFSVCATYTGCTPSSGTILASSGGNGAISFRSLFTMDGACYNVSGGVNGHPAYCPVQEIYTNAGTFTQSSAYPRAGILLNMSTYTNGTWNGADQPAFGINQETQGDGIFINDLTANAAAHFLNFFNGSGTAATVNVDGKTSLGNSATIHSGLGVLQIVDNTATCDMYTGASSPGFACSSDQRLKGDIKPSDDQLGWLGSFKIKQFNVLATREHVPAGVVAQELQTNHPEMVHAGQSGKDCSPGSTAGCLSVDTPNLWQMLKAMQEMQAEIVALQNRH